MKKTFEILLIIFFLNSCKNAPICVVNENNAGKEIYDINEASCFIALKLDQKIFDLNLIHDALIAEEKFMSEIDLISENLYQLNESDSNAELDINALVEYVLKNSETEFTKNELLEIYIAETGYLEFIGVVGE
ncbi:hypothetical protein [Bizionia arctica]|uniref:Uncharacterized protein n=1 Tax=Bizionia arctica TaxID=1495645 RepID=A0A917GXX7_9FLAO|nr:hypothetical protein [Bizionia arctica]GGG60546.1 hypothetical protein GCM10010976_34130 [Bizionia arctica]